MNRTAQDPSLRYLDLRRTTSDSQHSQDRSKSSLTPASDIESRSSRGSRQSNLSEVTTKQANRNKMTTMTGPSPRSTLLPPQGTNSGEVKPKPRNLFGFGSPTNNDNINNNLPGASKEDKKIAAYILRLKDELANSNAEGIPLNSGKVADSLTKIRMLLDVRVEKGDKTKLSDEIHLGSTIVEIMRLYSSSSAQAIASRSGTDATLIMEECTCILYFMSLLDPSFKKGVARLFKAMGDFKSNVAIQRAACEAIRNVVQANPDALPRIAPSLGVILQSMAAHGNNPKLIFKSMELLADLALEPVSKPLFVQKGGVGLLHILTAMNRHSSDAAIQAAGCRSISNLSLGATPEVLQRLTPALDVILRSMNKHTSHKHVQLYGTWALGNMAAHHHAEIVHQGGVDAILPTMRERMADGRLQEQGCMALSKLIEAAKDAETRSNYVTAICEQQGISTVLQAMTQHSEATQVQLQGLSVLLGCLAQSMDHFEIFLAEGGLDVMIRALTNFEANVDIATKGMELLKNFTRQSLDFQRAVFAKGGIGVVVGLMKTHRESHAVQDPGFACLRNIAIHPENRLTIAQHDGIPTMITNMQIYIEDAAIQAYGCDALGRLATGEQSNQEQILGLQGMESAVAAMVAHPSHPGVQDRSIFLLLQMTSHTEALARLKSMDALETIQLARIPQKEAAVDRCERLIRVLETKGWFSRK